MGLAGSLNTEQAIVSSLRHNDLIELHLETSQAKKTAENTVLQCCVLPAHLGWTSW